jgi:hypothetical protein
MGNVSFRKLNEKAYLKIESLLSLFADGKGSSVAISGSRGTGKSTVLREIPAMNKDLEYIIIDANRVTGAYNFFKLIAAALNFYPVETKNWADYAGFIFNFIEESDKKYVFIIDDFVMLNYIRDDIISFLRSKYMQLRNIMFIISMRNNHRRSFNFKHPFFAQFVFVNLNYYDKSKSDYYVRTMYNIDDEKLHEIIYRISEGNLEIADIVCTLISLAGKVYSNETETAISKILSFHFEHNTQRLAVLILLSEKNRTTHELITETGIAPSSMNTLLKRLIIDNYIEISGHNEYRIREYIKMGLMPGLVYKI